MLKTIHKYTPMKKFLSIIGLIVLAIVLLVVGWLLYNLFIPASLPSPQAEAPTPQEAEAPTPQEEAAQKSVEQIPELNPIEKTNPFGGSYKNPFKK